MSPAKIRTARSGPTPSAARQCAAVKTVSGPMRVPLHRPRPGANLAWAKEVFDKHVGA